MRISLSLHLRSENYGMTVVCRLDAIFEQHRLVIFLQLKCKLKALVCLVLNKKSNVTLRLDRNIDKQCQTRKSFLILQGSSLAFYFVTADLKLFIVSEKIRQQLNAYFSYGILK